MKTIEIYSLAVLESEIKVPAGSPKLLGEDIPLILGASGGSRCSFVYGSIIPGSTLSSPLNLIRTLVSGFRVQLGNRGKSHPDSLNSIFQIRPHS